MDKIGNLELTILELGAEVFRLKERISSLCESHGNYKQSFDSLKILLEERGVITVDDIESFASMSQFSDDIDLLDESGFFRESVTSSKRDLN